MSKATIEAYRKQRAEQIEIDRPTAYLGIHCRDCVIAWIVCELPQQMKYLIELMRKHQYCPQCKGDNLRPAAASEIRPLLKARL